MAYSLKNLNTLFESKGFVANNYFTLDGNYKLVEMISFKSATSIIVHIDSKYKVPSQKLKHEYTLLKKDVSGDLISGVANEGSLRSSYKEIDHISKALQTEEKLSELYDRPISLKGEEDRSLEKFSSTIRQMRRFRLCVKNIPYKFVLFDDDCICVLSDESEIETYYAPEYKHKKRKIFVSTSLSNLFASEDIDSSVMKITDQFHDILQENQKTETLRIQDMIDTKQNILSHSKRVLDIKKKLMAKIALLQKNHTILMDRTIELTQKKKDTNSKLTQNILNESTARSILESIRQELAKNEEQQHDMVRNIIDSRKELDELCLVVDNILFDNMVMMSRISANFRVLEMLK